MRTLVLYVALGAVLTCCAKKNEQDPELFGKWGDQSVIYYLNADHSFGQTFLLNGKGKDTVLVDSSFGTYKVNKNKKLITFDQQGYVLKSRQVVYEPKNGTVWNYELSGNTLTYKSNTSVGELIKLE